MRYLSVCSGIEAATCAWHPLGWQPEAFSEIEPFPSAVLAHHYPHVPNLGDMTKFKEWNIEPIDLIVGGTPCQSFSVAGLRKGLADPRGNLMLTYLAIAARFSPRWLVWENVPGVLSSNGGKDFGTLLGGLAELGYGFAYRILDAQYTGVPQRRRRVFVVGCLGDWRSAAAVLFERHSMQGHSAPSRKAGQSIAGAITRGAFSGGASGRPEGAAGNHFVPAKSLCLNAGGQQRNDAESETLIATIGGHFSYGIDEECNATFDGMEPLLRGGRGGTRQAVAFGIQANIINSQDHNGGNGMGFSENVAPTLTKADQHAVCSVTPTLTSNGDAHSGFRDENGLIASFKAGQGSAAGGIGYSQTVAPTLSAAEGGNRTPSLMQGMQVRRLLPTECEALQGFPRDYTNVMHNGKPAADGNRYKALGNSMAVPCMAWIGKRIARVEPNKRKVGK